MTFLLTLLTFFVDGKPNVPNPSTRGAITVPGEFDADAPASVGENLGLPRLTPQTWQASPSLMVAHPPASAKTFDVFSPAVRPPQEFPGLVACDPVALVPCPSPEPPAVRHVSFMDRVLPQPGSNTPYYDPSEAGAECTPHCFPSPEAAQRHRENPHAGQYTDPSHPFLPFAHPFPGFPHPPHPPHFGHMPVAFAAPFGGPMCPAGMPCPVAGESPLFPGAKKIQHVVRATYDVPHETAKALEPILEQSQGVTECSVEGDELTINAIAPSQTAIAHFLVTVVNQPRLVSQPAKAIDVKLNKSSCCNAECDCKDKCQCQCQCCGSKKPAKAIDVKLNKSSCCNAECDCKDKCQCCGSKKPAQAANRTTDPDKWYKKYFLAEKAREIEGNLGIDCPAACPKASECSTDCSKARQCSAGTPCPLSVDTGNGIFSFSVGFQRSKACSKATQCSATSPCKAVSPCTVNAPCKAVSPCTANASCTTPCETQATVQWKSTTQSKPVKVSIIASSDGVVVKTSDGTQLRAQQIQLETDGIHRLEVRNGDAVFTMPKPQNASPKPVKKSGNNTLFQRAKPVNTLPTY